MFTSKESLVERNDNDDEVFLAKSIGVNNNNRYDVFFCALVEYRFILRTSK